MKERTLRKDETIARQGEECGFLFFIRRGAIRQVMNHKEITLNPGDIAGLAECDSFVYLCDYVAAADNTQVVEIPYYGSSSLRNIFEEQPQLEGIFLRNSMEQCHRLLEQYEKSRSDVDQFWEKCTAWYTRYQTMCETNNIPCEKLEAAEGFMPCAKEGGMDKWEMDYFLHLTAKKDVLIKVYAGDSALVAGHTLASARSMQKAIAGSADLESYLLHSGGILISETERDLIQCFVGVLSADKENPKEFILEIKTVLAEILTYARQCACYPNGLVERKIEYVKRLFADGQKGSTQMEETEKDLSGSGRLDQVISYAEVEEEKAEKIRNLFRQYRSLPDLTSTEDGVRKLRKKVSKEFYRLYTKCFFRSVKEDEIPEEIQEFFYFGLIDTALVEEETKQSIRSICSQIYQCKGGNIYTVYDWLKAIYLGEKEPSKNEFDVDFQGHLLEMKKGGKITEEQLKELAHDREEMVKFEIDNMFVNASRGINGKVSTFCPVLQQTEIIGSVNKMLINVQKIQDALNEIKKVDYSVFYREVMFSDLDHGLSNEPIQKEVVPDVILFPLAGSRATMWQETANVRRDSPARFFFPILAATDINDLMIETVARYRWEICRKIQGMRWNDVKEKSLTSEYCDFLQFYRKNSQLSAEWKDKIKNALVRGKNNYREVFVMDYVSWIKYESKGSYRLNKTVREIIFRYCPYPSGIRKQLAANPTYQDIVQKYEMTRSKKLQRIQAVYLKYQKSGGTLNEELLANQAFYEQ